MSNTEKRGKGGARRRAAARVLLALALAPLPFALSGCRMDMQDQPRYEYYEPGDKKFFPDGASSRATVEGTVPRQTGQYRDRDDYLYTGKAAGGGSNVSGQPGGGLQSVAQTGGVGA